MGKILAKVPAAKQHPLAAQLRSVLNNPNASLGQLADIVNRINAELKLFEEQSKRQLKGAPKGKNSGDAEIEALRRLLADIRGQSQQKLR